MTNTQTFSSTPHQPEFMQPHPNLKTSEALVSHWATCCYSDKARRYLLHWAMLFTADTGVKWVYLPPALVENSKLNHAYTLAHSHSAAIDLVAYEESSQSWLKRALFGPPANRIINQQAASVLIVRQPRWPIQHIMFVTRGQRLDYGAIPWLVSLVQATQAHCTVLAVQPCLSANNLRALYGEGLRIWLASDTPLGYQLRSIVQQCPQLGEMQVEFVSGEPRRQIQQAITTRQPDYRRGRSD